MSERIRTTQKVLIVSNQGTTGPLWAMSLQQLMKLDVIFEPVPENTRARWADELPDLIILDVSLPDESLFELIRKLRSESILPILLLTTNRMEEFLVNAYQAGVDECIYKPIGPSLLHAKIRVWLRRSGNVPVATLDPLKVGSIQLVPADRILVMDGKDPIRLTNLELRLLYCLMSQPGRTVATEGLILRVWGSHGDGDAVALKNIIYRLRQKIEADPSNPKIIQTAAGVGYRFALQALQV